MVLGRRGLTRDIVCHALDLSGVATVDLVALDEVDANVVAVLVNPEEADWGQARGLNARVVVVNDGFVDAESSVDVLVRGAHAVVESDLEPDDLVEVIATVAAGEAFLSPRQAGVALERLRRMPDVLADQMTLTPRELDILASIDRGEVVKQTARHLAISEKTVQNIQSRLFRKLGARNRAQSVARAYEIGLLPIPPRHCAGR